MVLISYPNSDQFTFKWRNLFNGNFFAKNTSTLVYISEWVCSFYRLRVIKGCIGIRCLPKDTDTAEKKNNIIDTYSKLKMMKLVQSLIFKRIRGTANSDTSTLGKPQPQPQIKVWWDTVITKNHQSPNKNSNCMSIWESSNP